MALIRLCSNKSLLGFLPYNFLKQAQFNAVIPSKEEMDRVEFEPTISAILLRYSSKHDTLYFLLYNYF